MSWLYNYIFGDSSIEGSDKNSINNDNPTWSEQSWMIMSTPVNNLCRNEEIQSLNTFITFQNKQIIASWVHEFLMSKNIEIRNNILNNKINAIIMERIWKEVLNEYYIDFENKLLLQLDNEAGTELLKLNLKEDWQREGIKPLLPAYALGLKSDLIVDLIYTLNINLYSQLPIYIRNTYVKILPCWDILLTPLVERWSEQSANVKYQAQLGCLPQKWKVEELKKEDELQRKKSEGKIDARFNDKLDDSITMGPEDILQISMGLENFFRKRLEG